MNLEKYNSNQLGKPSLLLSILISLAYCFYIIKGNNSVAGARFSASHDPGLLYRTGFDLIHALSGGNSSWSLFDMANRTFISIGSITHSIFSLPIALVYFFVNKIFPNIPENVLYRNVFIFVFFPLVNLLITFGGFLWLQSLKLNNFVVSTFLIPLSIAIFSNEIYGLLLTTPTIALYPLLLAGATYLCRGKFKIGVFLLISLSFIGFIQTPLMFLAYTLPIPWLIIIIFGLIQSILERSKKILFIKRDCLLLITLLTFSVITVLPSYAGKFLNNSEKLNKILNLFNFPNSLENLLIGKISRFLILIDNSNIGKLFEFLSKLSFGICIFYIIYLAFIGIIRKKDEYESNNLFLIPNKILSKIIGKNKIIFMFFFVSSLIIFSDIFYTVLDLKNNFYTESTRLSHIFNLSTLHNRNFLSLSLNQFTKDILSDENNFMLNGRYGYVGPVFLLLAAYGFLITIIRKSIFRKIILSISLSFLLLTFLIYKIILPLNLLLFVLFSLLYPFAFLLNNLSMLTFSLDYLLIPFIAIGFNNLFLLIIDKKSLKLPFNFLSNGIPIDFSNKKRLIAKFLIFLPGLFFSIFELSKVKNLVFKNVINYDKFEPQKGIISEKKEIFLLDAQNPLLKSSPIYTYKDTLPIVKRTHEPFYEKINQYGSKQELTGEYYKTLFLNRFMDLSDPYGYEIRHKSMSFDSIKEEDCEPLIPNNSWESNFSCKNIPLKNNWPDTFFTFENQEKIISEKEISYKDLELNFQNCDAQVFECKYVNKLNITITKSDLNNSSIKLGNDMIGIPLPKYLKHISSNLFLKNKEVSLYSKELKKMLNPSQGYLMDVYSFDIGNIKKEYLVLKRKFVQRKLTDLGSILILSINSPNGVSILRDVSNSQFNYLINTKKGELVTISSPISGNLKLKQNTQNLNIKKNKNIPNFINFESMYDGISRISISYKNHFASGYSFIIVNTLITILTLIIVYMIFNLNLFDL